MNAPGRREAEVEMLVYGDPQFQERLSGLVIHLRRRLARTRREDLEALRSLLIVAGQFEQGLQDSGPGTVEPEALQYSVRATDLAAAAFHRAWLGASGQSCAGAPGTERALEDLRETLSSIPLDSDPLLTFKIPEGFECYALFPEQYCASAVAWAAAHCGMEPKQALVVGIRSIGTTLSALLQAALEAAGWQAKRLTVRPTSHPYDRRVELSPVQVAGARCALVVDEGPGLSGSSMAAAARTLSQLGISDISFFPGHNGQPGPAASAEVRRWWAQTPRYFTPLSDLRWQGLSLGSALASQAARLQGSGDCFDLVQDCSGGLWRSSAFSAEAEWPAVAPTLERMKVRCSQASGLSVLWKFAGFGCALDRERTTTESAMNALATRARQHLGPASLGTFRGFVAQPWVQGQRLRAEDRKDPAVLTHLGTYLAQTAGAPLTAAAAQRAHQRLAEMLYWNTREGCDERLADRTRVWSKLTEPIRPGPSYSDGRMAPHEWIRTPEGHLLKTDGTGHQIDHTLIGEQSLLWDVAGVVVEWDLESATPLLCSLRPAGIQLEPKSLMFHQMAYAAFRLGVCCLFATQGLEAKEQARLERAAGFYRERLVRWLEQVPSEDMPQPSGN